MHYLTGVLHMAIFTFITEGCIGNEYSKQTNYIRQDGADLEQLENPFRMQKVNILWGKAKKTLSSAQLANLYEDLDILDQYEAELNKMKSNEMDMDGAMEAKGVENFKRVLDNYGFNDLSSQVDAYMSNEIRHEDGEKKSVHFQDPKLQNIWRKAEQAGFTEEDLNMLKEEFLHQQMKIYEYEFAQSQTDKIEDPQENSINFWQKKFNLSTAEAKERNEAMKKEKRDIEEGFLRLQHLVSSHPGAEPTFIDPRIRTLWALAKETNWSEEQLSGFKEELFHFEYILSNQAYYQKQLDLSAKELQGNLKEGDETWERHQELEEKNKYLGHKIQKLKSELRTRLDTALAHSEL